jgi:RimJ/RimL family protein N-acetyltransferase
MEATAFSTKALPTLVTERLMLRPWRADDLAAFAALNADPQVMALFPTRLTTAQSDAAAAHIAAHIAHYGFGLWVVEAPGVAPFVGVVGLMIPGFQVPFTSCNPCIEIGWRLAYPFWGRGYATEAARAALAYGFDVMGLDEIVSFTTPDNVASWRVMERLGMTHDPAENFDHPALPAGHPLRRHVLYRLRARAYSDSRTGRGISSSRAK